MKQSGIAKENQKFQEKWKIGLDLLQKLKGRIDYRAVVFDAGYGEIGPLLCELEKRGESYVGQISSGMCFWPKDIELMTADNSQGRPRKYPAIADKKARPLTASQWAQKIEKWCRFRLPTKKKTHVKVAAIRVLSLINKAYYRPGTERWLIIEKLPDGEIKYYLSNLPPSTSVRELLELAHQRWKIEQGYQQLKEELGLDHFEGRSWLGLHHHILLCFMAYAFLILLRKKHIKKNSANTPCSS
jgi:SRSO17 transposase